MVVGKKDPSDLKLGRGTLILKGKRFNVTVFGDKKAPNRADVFAPDIGKLPKTGKLRFKGKTMKARLSFRTGRGGSRIPVFTAKLPKSLRGKTSSMSLTEMGESELGSLNGGLSL